MTNASELSLDTFTLVQNGRVLTAAFSSPPLNLGNFAFMRDLDILTRAVDRDDSIGAVVLTGGVEGKFIAHADPADLSGVVGAPIPQIPKQVFYPAWVWARTCLRVPGAAWITGRLGGTIGRAIVWGHQWRRATLRISRSSTVYLAAINGSATGAGHEIALACDVRYVSDAPHIRLGQIEILATVLPGGGGAHRLPRMIGTGRALEHMLEGAPMTAQQALEMGSVTRVVPDADLLAVSQTTAARLVRRSPKSISAIKQLTHASTNTSLSRGLDKAIAAFAAAGIGPVLKNTMDALNADTARIGDSPLALGAEAWVEGNRVDQVS